jgi:hypothetical protein
MSGDSSFTVLYFKFKFLHCSNCFGRYTARHQELKNFNCSLLFYKRFWLKFKTHIKPESAIKGFELLMMGGVSHFWLQPKTHVKLESTITVFELLMMGGVSPETC